MNIELLLDQNSWWKGKEKINTDYDIKKWQKKKHKWVPDILKEIPLNGFSLHFLLGPRQVGKTTTIKLLIKKILNKNNPKAIFYFRCDELSDYKELKQVLTTYLSFREENNIEKSYIFLDEITTPKEWYRTIKSLIDAGKFEKDVLILTGSNTLTIKKHTELFPGRRGKGKDYTLMPLTFRQFIKITKPELYNKLPPKIKEFDNKTIKSVINKNIVHLPETNKLLKKYLKSGGFPLSIQDILNNKKISTRTEQAHLNWIKGDLLKDNKSDVIAKQILKTVMTKIPSPISWQSISSEIAIKSPKTVSSYLQFFQNIFTLNILYHLDLSSKTINFAKNKKIHFTDPFLLHLFEKWCLLEIKNKESILTETLLASHLNRRFPEKTFYWKNKKEIDVIIMTKKLHGFEAKVGSGKRIRKPSQISNILTISKNKTDLKKEPMNIPLSLFLSIL